ncbi:MAG TPA: amidohydrolase family protein [Frankiaceae bacterium]|nr:amidohydrolase family protein [Frankiaceae bacterium]
MTAVSAEPSIAVIDADTHLTEPHDLWTARAPQRLRDRVPQVRDVNGQPTWTVDGVAMQRASASSVVHKDGSRCRGTAFIGWTFDDAHPAAYDVASRVQVMDELGVWAQIVYPNAAGFGGQRFGQLTDLALKNACATLYNDAMVDLQTEANGRLFPMALLPWWDAAASVAEAERAADLGLRGVNMTSDPQQGGAPDLASREWDRLWEVCADRGLPVNFHIGASETSLSWFGSSPWPSHGDDQKLAIGSAMMYLTNARVIANLIFSGLLERHPKLRFVSVESGIGWIPFVLEALNHQKGELPPGVLDYMTLSPLEYFQRQIYACFWFEKQDVSHTLELLGADNILFETDFPHPTCLYPDSMALAAPGLADLTPGDRRKVLQDNASALYRIPLPDQA